MRKYIIAVCGLAILSTAFANTAYAHVLESDGDVAAVLHMPPDDVPTAGENTYVGLAFSSNDRSFDIKQYEITLGIQRNGVNRQTATLAADGNSSRDGSAKVIFPEAGSYRIVATGLPRQSGKAFELSYNIRVSPAAGSAAGVSGAGVDFWVLSLGGIATLVIIARYNIIRGKRYQMPKTPVQH